MLDAPKLRTAIALWADDLGLDLSNLDGDMLIDRIRSALVATPPAGGDDWTVDDTLTAREILDYLGIGSDASLEPYADRRRDAVAKIIQKRIVATPPAEQHPDDIAVDRFAASMKEKLKWEREQRNRSGWQAMSAADLSRILYEHLPKGDPVDVANLSMMLHQNGQQIETPPAEPVVEADFDSWWRASKYRQVIYADESQRQIALDAWRAALATKPAVKDDETVVEALDASGAIDAVAKAVAELQRRVDAGEYVIATLITNLKTGNCPPEKAVEWFEAEGRATLAAKDGR